jgi:hypothetical protein
MEEKGELIFSRIYALCRDICVRIRALFTSALEENEREL